MGAKPGGEVTVKTSFPAAYPVAALRGKDAEFEVTVKEVEAPVEAAIDDAFAKRMGMSDLAALKEALTGPAGGRVRADVALPAQARAAGRARFRP